MKKYVVQLLKYFIYRKTNIKSGKNVKYKSLKSNFSNTKNITFGNNVFIGPGADFDGAGGLNIDDNVIIAPNVTILTRNHYYDGEDLRALPFDNRVILKPVIIEKNIWIGTGVIIMPGVIIGEGAVVASGSIVTKDVPPLSIVCGNPAKVLKKRNETAYKKLSERNIFVYSKFGHEKEFVNFDA